MPSDHVISNETAFVRAIEEAARVAEAGKIVLFGIKPSEPHTGYGYVRQGAKLDGADHAYIVDEFCEKPDHGTAEAYVAAGRYFSNGGILVFQRASLPR